MAPARTAGASRSSKATCRRADSLAQVSPTSAIHQPIVFLDGQAHAPSMFKKAADGIVGHLDELKQAIVMLFFYTWHALLCAPLWRRV